MKKTLRTVNQLIVIALMVLLVIPGGFFMSPQQAHAQSFEIVFDPNNYLENVSSALTSQLISVATDTGNYKEFILDALVWFANNVLIKHITRSVVNWINSGFEGNPTFVTDFQGFLTDAIDAEIGRFIEGTALGFLCDPFELQIRVALAIKYRSLEEQITCRLSEVVDNIDNFISGAPGSFQDGGWRGWFQLVKDDNPYNRYLEASAALEANIVTARGEKIELFRVGAGFLPFEKCFLDDAGIEVCETVTPGSVIETQLNETLSLGGRRITVADEINEILGALLAQLTTRVLGGGGGLRGLSRSSGQRTSSYLDQLQTESAIPETVTLGAPGGEIIDITQGIDLETRYRESLTEVRVAVFEIENLLFALATCGAQSTASLEARIEAIGDPLDEATNITDRNLALLNTLNVRRQNATSVEAVEAINEEFETLVEAGTFHTLTDLINLETNQRETLDALGQIQAEVSQALTQCRALEGGSSLNTQEGGAAGGGDTE